MHQVLAVFLLLRGNATNMRTQVINGNTENELANRVVQLVEEHWAEYKKPLLLSELGSSENGAIGKMAKDTSGSLAFH